MFSDHNNFTTICTKPHCYTLTATVFTFAEQYPSKSSKKLVQITMSSEILWLGRLMLFRLHNNIEDALLYYKKKFNREVYHNEYNLAKLRDREYKLWKIEEGNNDPWRSGIDDIQG